MLNNPNKSLSALLAIVSLMSIFAMLHHPSVSSAGVAAQISEVNEESFINTLVHSVLIAFLVVISLCLTQYAKSRGFHRSSVLFGIILYWLGSTVMILAALMSGIVGPEIASNYLQADKSEYAVFKGLFNLTHALNQAFAYCAVFCWCAAMLCWALDMLQKQAFVRIFGVFSALAALVCSITLLFGWLTLNVFGMTVILVVISIWQLGIAKLLYSQPIK